VFPTRVMRVSLLISRSRCSSASPRACSAGRPGKSPVLLRGRDVDKAVRAAAGNSPPSISPTQILGGNISIELLRHGYDVRSYDLNEYDNYLTSVTTGQDVLTLEKPKDARALITNPPYHKDLPRLIAEKGVAEYDLTALFVRLTFLEGKKRKKLFTNHPPSDILFLSDRIRFDRPDYTGLIEPINKAHQLGGMIAYCWVVWNKNARHENTRLRWVVLKDEYDEWRTHYDQRSNSGGG